MLSSEQQGMMKNNEGVKVAAALPEPSNHTWSWQKGLRIILLSQMGDHHKTNKVKTAGEDALLETSQWLMGYFCC